MSTLPVIECPVSDETRRALEAGWAAYQAATETHGRTDEWDNRVIRQCIRAFVLQGKPFSANDMRNVLPEVRKCLISRRLIEAQKDGLIRRVGFTPSTLASTKCALVRVYAPIPGALDD